MNLLYPDLAHHEIDRRLRTARDHRRARAARRAMLRTSRPEPQPPSEHGPVRR